MEPKFLNANDVHLRIDGGIVLFDGIPMLAYQQHNDDSETTLKLWDLGVLDNSAMPEGEIIDANDPRLYTKSLEVGYMNHRKIITYENDDISKPIFGKHAGFVSRGTNRKQKSILHPSNLYITWCGQTNLIQLASSYINTGDFRDMLLNEYPKSRDFSGLKKGESIALSRNFAILAFTKEVRLYFNSHEIGRKKEGEAYFQLDAGYDHSIMVLRLADLNIPV